MVTDELPSSFSLGPALDVAADDLSSSLLLGRALVGRLNDHKSSAFSSSLTAVSSWSSSLRAVSSLESDDESSLEDESSLDDESSLSRDGINNLQKEVREGSELVPGDGMKSDLQKV